MKYLLATSAYSNPELLEKCVRSWPEEIDSMVYADKNIEVLNCIDPWFKGDKVGSTEHSGVSGSWNWLLEFAFGRDYDALVVVGSDTEMQPGFLKDFLEEYEQRGLDFAVTRYPIIWNCWVMNRRCYETVGVMDCNLWPAYYEDNDYHRRVNLSGLGIDYIGNPDGMGHFGSATIRKDPVANKANGITFGMNQAYYVAKWGGLPGEEKFPTPFNDPTLTIKDWTLDQETRQRKYDIWNGGII